MNTIKINEIAFSFISKQKTDGPNTLVTFTKENWYKIIELVDKITTIDSKKINSCVLYIKNGNYYLDFY